MKVAIVGANGQVASEVCLRLRAISNIEVVPVVRNPSGSAFLRAHGFTCRHGRVADEAEASLLLHDCDVVANFALSTTGSPRRDHTVNTAIARNTVNAAAPKATVIFFSTIMVYAPGMSIRIPDAYGAQKWLAERVVRKAARQTGRTAYVLRLGHVLGDLQNVSAKIVRELTEGLVFLPQAGASASNSVFTATVCEAVHRIAAGQVPPDTYDLITNPQWTWREVYEHYARTHGVTLRLHTEQGPPRNRWGLGASMRRLLGMARTSQLVRERLAFLLGLMPQEMNDKIQMRYYQAQALAEIRALDAVPIPSVPDWRALVPHAIAGLAEPLKAMGSYPLPADSPAAGMRLT